MKIIVFLLTLLIPSTASPKEMYDVSCKNISAIRIVRIDATHWDVDSHKGCLYSLALDFKEDAANDFAAFLDQYQRIIIYYRGINHSSKDVIITANGRQLRNDAPALMTFADKRLFIITPKKMPLQRRGRSALGRCQKQYSSMVIGNDAIGQFGVLPQIAQSTG